jgi:hypothetical protein
LCRSSLEMEDGQITWIYFILQQSKWHEGQTEWP